MDSAKLPAVQSPLNVSSMSLAGWGGIMDIQDLGAIGEFIASIAVLVTLVFLTIETRQNTTALKRANVKQTTSEHSHSLYAIQAPGVAEVFVNGIKDLNALSEIDRYRFDISCYTWLASIEQAFEDNQLGNYPDKSLTIFKNNIPGVLLLPGGKQWWKERNVWFTPEFRDVVERLLAQPPVEFERGGVFPRKSGDDDL